MEEICFYTPALESLNLPVNSVRSAKLIRLPEKQIVHGDSTGILLSWKIRWDKKVVFPFNDTTGQVPLNNIFIGYEVPGRPELTGGVGGACPVGNDPEMNPQIRWKSDSVVTIYLPLPKFRRGDSLQIDYRWVLYHPAQSKFNNGLPESSFMDEKGKFTVPGPEVMNVSFGLTSLETPQTISKKSLPIRWSIARNNEMIALWESEFYGQGKTFISDVIHPYAALFQEGDSITIHIQFAKSKKGKQPEELIFTMDVFENIYREKKAFPQIQKIFLTNDSGYRILVETTWL